MSNWNHKHIIDLSTFSVRDYETILELANRFKALPQKGPRKLPALQGKLIANLFFEPSTRTRSSFELAAKRLSADVLNFSANISSLSKGETPLDTALTYISMGADILIVRHESTNLPSELASYLDKSGEETSILNAGDGLHSHPSQGLLDLFTLARYFNPEKPLPNALSNKKIAIIGDILHSRVARSNLWALTGCGADVILCGPPSLLPEDFENFVKEPPPGQTIDPINKRGKVLINRSLKDALEDIDAIMTLRIQKERMNNNLISSLERYKQDYEINHQRLKWCKKNVPILHPGPVNRDIEMSGEILDDKSYSLVREQVENSIPIRMALLYLLSSKKQT